MFKKISESYVIYIDSIFYLKQDRGYQEFKKEFLEQSNNTFKEESLACRFLLFKEFQRCGKSIFIEKYTDKLPDNKFFSFSHKGDYASIGISNLPVGIDIELFDEARDYHKIIQRVSPSEKKLDQLLCFKNRSNLNSLLLFSAKESVFKKVCITNVDTIIDLVIERINTSTIQVRHKSNTYQVNYEIIEIKKGLHKNEGPKSMILTYAI